MPTERVVPIDIIREQINRDTRVQRQSEAFHEQARAIIESPSTSEGQHVAARAAVLSADAMLVTPTKMTIQAAQANAQELKIEKNASVSRLGQLLTSLISAVLNVIQGLTQTLSENKSTTADFKQQQRPQDDKAEPDEPSGPTAS